MARLLWGRLSPFAPLPLSMTDADWTVTDAAGIAVAPWAALGANLYRVVVDSTKTGTAIYGRRLRDLDGDLAEVATGAVSTKWSMTWPGTTPTGGSGVSVLLGLSLSATLADRYLLFGRRQGAIAANAATYRVYSTSNLAGEAAPQASADVSAATSPAFGVLIEAISTTHVVAGKCHLLSAAGVRASAVELGDPSFALAAGDLYEIVAVRCTGVGAGNETVDVRAGRLTTQQSGYMPPA